MKAKELLFPAEKLGGADSWDNIEQPLLGMICIAMYKNFVITTK